MSQIALDIPLSLASAGAATAAESEQVGFGDGLILTIVGMSVVFVSLVVLWGVILAIFRAVESRPTLEVGPEAGSASAPQAAPASAYAHGVPPEHVPVILAAAAKICEDLGPHRIALITAAAVAASGGRVTRIAYIRPLSWGGSGPWSTGGRRSIMGSHRPHLHRRSNR